MLNISKTYVHKVPMIICLEVLKQFLMVNKFLSILYPMVRRYQTERIDVFFEIFDHSKVGLKEKGCYLDKISRKILVCG